MTSVNVTCSAPNLRRPCAGCRASTKALISAGFRVHQSGRYEALRAAAAAAYGFDACIAEIGRDEPAVADAIVSLLCDKHVLLVADDTTMLPELPASFALIGPREYESGELPPKFLNALR